MTLDAKRYPILVVDDEQDNLDAFRFNFRKTFDILTASGGAEALQILETKQVAVVVTESTASDVCFVHVLDETRQRLVLMGATPPFSSLSGTVELELGEGVAGWVALNAEPAIVPDKWKDDRYVYIPALRGEDYESLVSVPLLDRGQRVVGVINVHASKPRRYGEHDVDLLTQVGNLMARTISWRTSLSRWVRPR